jgi:hypothetical protein
VPGVEGEELVTVSHPAELDWLMILTFPASATTTPGVAQVAGTLTLKLNGIVTVLGRFQ